MNIQGIFDSCQTIHSDTKYENESQQGAAQSYILPLNFLCNDHDKHHNENQDS